MNKLKKYIEEKIYPLYSKNDSGHGIDHINYVTERCLRFAAQFGGINSDMLFVAAAYHDIAHHIDKNNHETLSAQIFYKDERIKDFFTDEERLIIKEAIEDHRASSETLPRSDYGKIISSADRSTSLEEFLSRTHAYTLKHTPDCTAEEMLERAFRHTAEKYGNGGYAKSYVEDEEYARFREQINRILADRRLFDETYQKINCTK